MTNIATTIFSIIVFQVLSALNIGNTDVERGLYVFVCWFFVFLIGLFLHGYLPGSIGQHVGKFSVSLMIDGILILTGTLFVMWGIPLFSQNASYDAPITYFSIYYFLFATLIKVIAQKKYILNISRVGLIFLFVLIVANILPLPVGLRSKAFILTVLDVMLLTGISLYYFLNKMLSDLVPQNPR